MLKRYDIIAGKVAESEQAGAPIFLYVNPDPEERRYLVDTLKVDEHTLQSAMDPDELSRVEFEPEHMAIILKRPRNYSGGEQFLFRVASSGLFLYKDKLIVVVAEDGLFFSGKVFQNVASLADVMLRLIYNSIFHFLEHLKVIQMVSDELEQKINTSMENRHLINMFMLEKSLVYYLNAIHSNGYNVGKLKNFAAKIGFTTTELEFLDDISVENDQCYRLAEIYTNVISSLMDARASLVSNNLNVMMKNLNAIVIAIAIPSFFAGMGGMSEFSMIAGADNWMIAYPLFFSIMMGIGISTFFIIKKIEKYWR